MAERSYAVLLRDAAPPLSEYSKTKKTGYFSSIPLTENTYARGLDAQLGFVNYHSDAVPRWKVPSLSPSRPQRYCGVGWNSW